MDKLTIDDLKKEWQKVDVEAKQWMRVMTSEKEYTLNAIATLHFNACNKIKRHIQNRIGEIISPDLSEGFRRRVI